MATIRPIKADDKLSLVDHLDELRSRIITILVVFAIAFAFCMWQSDALLNIVNEPMEKSQRAAAAAGEDPLAADARHQQQVAEALSQTAIALERVSAAMAEMNENGEPSAAERRRLAETREALDSAAAALASTAAATPEYEGRRPVTLGVAEPFMTTLMVAGYGALLLILPLLLYQLYAFILPAFTPRERKVAMPLMLMIPALFLIGAIFTYFVVLPSAIGFLQGFSAGSFDVLLQARTYYKFAILMMVGIGLLFQIPVAVLVITRLGIVTPRQLRKNRGYVILGVTILAAIGNGSPDPFTMLLVMVPLIALFEISVAVAAWIDRTSPVEDYREPDRDESDDQPSGDDE